MLTLNKAHSERYCKVLPGDTLRYKNKVIRLHSHRRQDYLSKIDSLKDQPDSPLDKTALPKMTPAAKPTPLSTQEDHSPSVTANPTQYFQRIRRMETSIMQSRTRTTFTDKSISKEKDPFCTTTHFTSLTRSPPGPSPPPARLSTHQEESVTPTPRKRKAPRVSTFNPHPDKPKGFIANVSGLYSLAMRNHRRNDVVLKVDEQVVTTLDDMTQPLFKLLCTLINKYGNGVKLQKKLMMIPGMTPFIKTLLFEFDSNKLRYREYQSAQQISAQLRSLYTSKNRDLIIKYKLADRHFQVTDEVVMAFLRASHKANQVVSYMKEMKTFIEQNLTYESDPPENNLTKNLNGYAQRLEEYMKEQLKHKAQNNNYVINQQDLECLKIKRNNQFNQYNTSHLLKDITTQEKKNGAFLYLPFTTRLENQRITNIIQDVQRNGHFPRQD